MLKGKMPQQAAGFLMILQVKIATSGTKPQRQAAQIQRG